VDSDAVAFEQCARLAYRNACRQANPVLLEPIMKLEVVTPEEYTGDVVGDLNRRRGIMEGMELKNKAQVVRAKVPLSEMFGYVTQLRTITSGRATSIMEFSHFAQAPSGIAEEVVAKAQGKVKVD
jgi:elongation factor G